MAHCKMLAETGIITQEESEQMLSVLNSILNQIEDGTFEIDKEAEDIHSQVEAILIEKLGDTGKKIHNGKIKEMIRFYWISNCIYWMKSVRSQPLQMSFSRF